MSKITPAAARRYADYTTVVAEDTDYGSVIDQLDDGTWAKFYYRIFRVPSSKEFTLRMCRDATPREREHAARVLESMPSGGWSKFRPEVWFKRRSPKGYFHWHVFGGEPLEDPLVQLELELMIDLEEAMS